MCGGKCVHMYRQVQSLALPTLSPGLERRLENLEGARKGKVPTVEVQQSAYTVRLYSGKQPDGPFAAQSNLFACWKAFSVLVYFN